MKKHATILKKSTAYVVLATIIFLSGMSNNAFAIARNSNVVAGNWNVAGTWLPAGIPVAGDVLTILAGHTVTLTGNTAANIGNVTVNGIMLFSTAGAPGKALLMAAGTTLQVNGTVDMVGQEGNITIGAGSFFNIGAGGTFIWLPLNNTAGGATIFTNTTESFNATSNLIIDTWYDLALGTAPPLGSVVTGNFGNVHIRSTVIGASIYNWYQDNQFQTHQILGNLTLGGTGATQGAWITLDRTNAMTTTTIGGNVSMDNINSRLYVHLGASTGAKTLNIGGSLTLTNNFWLVGIYGINGVAADASLTINVAGSFTNNNNCYFFGIFNPSTAAGSSTNGNFTLNITGDYTNNNTSLFYGIYNASTTSASASNGNFNMTANNILFNSGVFNGIINASSAIGSTANGTATLTLAGSYTNNNASLFYGIYNASTASGVQADGNFVFNVAGNYTNNNTSLFYGIYNFSTGTGATTNGHCTISIAGNYTNNNASLFYGIYNASTGTSATANGQCTIGITGTYTNNATSLFYGIHSASNAAGSTTSGNFNMTAGNIIFNNGVFYGILTRTTYNIITGALTFLANSANGNAVVTVNNTLTGHDGTFFVIRDGDGNATLNVTGNLLMTTTATGIDFRGIYNLVTWATGTNIGSSTVNVGGNFDFDEGIFMVSYGIGSATDVVTLNITGNLDINFVNPYVGPGIPYDIFRPVGFGAFTNPPPTFCLSPLNMDVGGNMIISGVAGGEFISSVGGGIETVDIIGGLTISGGTNSFNIIPNYAILATNGHTVTTNIGQSVSITGGNTYLSAAIGTLTATIGDNLSITGAGTLSVKGADGTATVNVQDAYTQTLGTFFLHNNAADATGNVITITINSDGDAAGDFSQTGGILNFDNNTTAGSGTHVINVLSPNYTIGGTAIMTQSNHLTAGIVFGQLNFVRAGTTLYNRSSNTHDMQQVKQTVNAGTTVDASASVNNMQIASHVSATAADHNSLTINGTLALGTMQIFGRTQANYYSQVTVNSGGRLRTQHTSGLYNATSTAAIDGLIAGTNRMNYFLDPSSIVEYYGVDNQILTGINVGIATTNNHKYGILDINFGGTADAEWVYPTATPTTTTAVYVRTQLVLTAGELNLDNDHATATGGRTITIENNATTGITRTSGYIRSEVEDGTGIVRWQMAAVAGAHVYAFGYDAANYIPFTFNPTGAAGDVNVGTYHTNVANLPFPPTVTHVNAASTGLDNSALTVDRFWTLTISGTGGANIIYICTPSEAFGIPNPRAQRWIPNGWELPLQGTQSTVATGTQADGVTGLTTWWTLADLTSPLPVQLVDFTAVCDVKNKVALRWTTASEMNNDYFIVEKSADGINFENLVEINGAGNSTSLVNYNYSDNDPYKGVTYYRLKQVDFSGNSEYFKTVSAGTCSDENTLLSAWVLDNQLHLLINNRSDSNYEAVLFDMQGRVVCKKSFLLETGLFEEVIDLSGISHGIYSLSILNHDEIISSKLMIQ